MRPHDRTSQPAGPGTPPRGPIGPFAIGAAGVVLCLFAYHALTWRSFTGSIDPFTTLFCDFVDYYYPMGEAVFRAELPVEGFLYSPFVAILLAVFPPLGPVVSLVLWGILQVLFVVLYLLLFRRLVPARLPIQLLFLALVLSSYPLLLNFLGGSVSVFMIVPILGMLVLYDRGLRATAAGLLAFAVSFKFYPVIFVAPFAAGCNKRFVLFAATACVLVLFVIPGIFLGGGDTFGFYSALFDAFRDSDWVTGNPHSQYFPHIVFRLAGAMGHDVQSLLPLLRWIAIGIAAANMGLIFLIQRARLRHACLWSLQIVFLTLQFVLKTSWPHDFVFLTFTQALLAWRLLEGEKTVRGSDTAGNRLSARVAVVVFLLPSIVFSNIVFFNILGDFRAYGFYGFIFWADLLLLIALYMEFLPSVLRRPNK